MVAADLYPDPGGGIQAAVLGQLDPGGKAPAGQHVSASREFLADIRGVISRTAACTALPQYPPANFGLLLVVNVSWKVSDLGVSIPDNGVKVQVGPDVTWVGPGSEQFEGLWCFQQPHHGCETSISTSKVSLFATASTDLDHLAQPYGRMSQMQP